MVKNNELELGLPWEVGKSLIFLGNCWSSACKSPGCVLRSSVKQWYLMEVNFVKLDVSCVDDVVLEVNLDSRKR